MRFRKIVFPAIMLAASLYILLPTADEIIIHPTFGLFLSYILSIPYVYGVLLSMLIYRAVGLVCLLAALVTGGKPVYLALKSKLSRRNQRRPQVNPL